MASGTPDSDVRVPTLFGVALTFADRLAAADILPTRFAEPAAVHLFADLDAGLAGRIEPGSVLVAGQGLGHGAGGEAAARSLAAAGFVATVAASFADGFDEHCLAAGVPPLEVDAPSVFHTGHRVRINCEAGTIANLSSGDRQPIRNVSEAMLLRLRALLGR
jgi:3-isopropylmalate/(R)-2-methylmalate dehydratase small subunit